jgi:spoIIIJ-associated protein
MIKEIIASGKDIIEAKENARAALGAGPLDDVSFEILHIGSKGIFGLIGVKPAQVKATIEIADAPERKRSERPRREKTENASDNAVKSEEKSAENKNEGGEKKHSRKKKHKKSHGGAKSTEKNDNATAEISIPEIKMERRTVEDGEDMSYDFVKTVLSDIGLNAEAELYACEDGTRRITIVGDDASTLIGHHGDTLDALQYLANLASARKNVHGERDKSRVTIDIEGYRAKGEATLRALARRMAAKALRNRRSVMLEPMSAYERRIIHSEIQGIEGVSTNSIGSDNNRKIVIYLTDKKPQGIFEEEEVVTPLKEEFAKDLDDVTDSVLSLDTSVSCNEDDECETVVIEATRPADDYSVFDDDDNK